MPPYFIHFDMRHGFIPGALIGGANDELDDFCFKNCTTFASRAPIRNAPATAVVLSSHRKG